MKNEARIGDWSTNYTVIYCTCKITVSYLSPIRIISKSLIASSIVPLYAHYLYEMTRCIWWRIGHIVSLCFFLRFSHAARAQPQALLAQQVQQTNHDRLGAVASENKICSQIGIDLLEAGGNAADAVGSRNYSSYQSLTIGTACGNDAVHWRGWSAIYPRSPEQQN